MNSFAMIFGHCVWMPPSPMAALVALNLFFGIGIQTNSEHAAAEAAIVNQYVLAGKTEAAAKKAVAELGACFGTYEVPPENRNHPENVEATRPAAQAGHSSSAAAPVRKLRPSER